LLDLARYFDLAILQNAHGHRSRISGQIPANRLRDERSASEKNHRRSPLARRVNIQQNAGSADADLVPRVPRCLLQLAIDHQSANRLLACRGVWSQRLLDSVDEIT